MGRKVGLKIAVAGMVSLPRAARQEFLYKKAVRLAFDTSRRTVRGEVNVIFLSRAAMLRMNRHYLGHDYDTDVITFEHERVPGVREAEIPIGDIFISAWMTRKQAKELGHPVEIEAATLAAHGALHLLGHDDRAPAAKARMFAVQDRIVDALRKK